MLSHVIDGWPNRRRLHFALDMRAPADEANTTLGPRGARLTASHREASAPVIKSRALAPDETRELHQDRWRLSVCQGKQASGVGTLVVLGSPQGSLAVEPRQVVQLVEEGVWINGRAEDGVRPDAMAEELADSRLPLGRSHGPLTGTGVCMPGEPIPTEGAKAWLAEP